MPVHFEIVLGPEIVMLVVSLLFFNKRIIVKDKRGK